MISNSIETKKGFQRIIVTDDNEVRVISVRKGYRDEPETSTLRVKRNYQLVKAVTVGEQTMVQCLGKTSIDVFSIKHCMKICELGRDCMVTYNSVAGEEFVKVQTNEGEKIYDELGHLIASSSEEELNMIFSGTGPCLQKRDRKSGHTRLFSLEGSIIGIG